MPLGFGMMLAGFNCRAALFAGRPPTPRPGPTVQPFNNPLLCVCSALVAGLYFAKMFQIGAWIRHRVWVGARPVNNVLGKRGGAWIN